MRNAELDEAQAGIKIARRNINNLRYADDTTLLAESEKEQKSLLMKVKEESEKVVRTQHSVNKAEGDVFLVFSCFFNDPTVVDNLISGSSAFSKSNLNIWKFIVMYF